MTQEDDVTIQSPAENDRFLRNIQNQDLEWKFQIIGGLKIVARVIDFLWTDAGIPITLTLQPTRGSWVEVPWGSIQTITRGKR